MADAGAGWARVAVEHVSKKVRSSSSDFLMRPILVNTTDGRFIISFF